MLAHLAEGLLGALQRSRLERHLSQCFCCSAELDRVRGTASITKPKRAGPFERARSVFRQRTESATLRRFTSALRFDSATMPPAFGMRGGTASSDRQLVFESGPFEIELHTRQERAGWSVSGQVLGPTEATSGEVRLIGPRTNSRSALSDLLEFRLPLAPQGTYRLELRLDGDALLRIDCLELGS
jgi:anti-sigma factor RsiW